MKRGILAFAGLIALLALPVAATGDSRALRGDQFEVSFVLKSQNGEPTELKNFRFKRLEGVCDNKTTVKVRGKFPSIEVNNRNRFHDAITKPGRSVRLKGKVSNNLATVRGTIRAKGDFGPTAQNCDSGKVRWTAS